MEKDIKRLENLKGKLEKRQKALQEQIEKIDIDSLKTEEEMWEVSNLMDECCYCILQQEKVNELIRFIAIFSISIEEILKNKGAKSELLKKVLEEEKL